MVYNSTLRFVRIEGFQKRNTMRKKTLIRVFNLLDQIKGIAIALESIKQDEEERFSLLARSYRNSEKGEKFHYQMEAIYDAANELQDVLDKVKDKLTYL